MEPLFNIEKAAIHASLASSFHHNSPRNNLNKHLSLFPVKTVKSSLYPASARNFMSFEEGKSKRRGMR